MEAVATVGLVSSVIQLVDFTAKWVGRCREIYLDGDTSQNASLERDAGEIGKLMKAVQDSMRGQPNGPEEKRLQACAKHCTDAATDLEVVLDGLRSRPGSRRGALWKSMKTAWKKDRLSELEARLAKQQSFLDSTILVDLRNRDIANRVWQESNFEQLDAHIQAAATSLLDSSNTVADIAQHIILDLERVRLAVIEEGAKTRTHMDNVAAQSHIHVTHQFEKLHLDLEPKRRSLLLQSLAFPEMNSRKESVTEAHARTFQWIFSRKWFVDFDNFADWLESGTGCYWINGKPGSGKSTLMSYILQVDRCEALLKLWSGPCQIMRPCFFFWNPGTDMQKNFRGFLRSLIYQMLVADEALEHFVISGLNVQQKKDLELGGTSNIDWSQTRLLAILRSTMASLKSRHWKICFFIDGLDEYNGDVLEFLEWITTTSKLDHIKFCISSRPWPMFEQAFASAPSLKLQDLTRADFKAFIETNFTRKVLETTSRLEEQDVQDVAYELLRRADGIFLWVSLVVAELLRAITDGDTVDDLWKRLDRTPSELAALFQHIIDNQVDPYHRDTALQLLTCMACLVQYQEMPFAILSMVVYQPLRSVHNADLVLLNSEEALKHCRTLERQFAARTGGLLIARLPDNLWRFAVLRSNVRYLHGSVSDWLRAKGRISATVRREMMETAFKSAVFCQIRMRPVLEHEPKDDISMSSKDTRTVWLGMVIELAKIMDYDYAAPCVQLLDLVKSDLAALIEPEEPLQWAKWASFGPHLKIRCAIIDFVGLAAYCRLGGYVSQKLLETAPVDRKSYAEYLLCCLTWPWPKQRVENGHRLICELLATGADVNTKFHGYSSWDNLMSDFVDCYEHSPEDLSSFYPFLTTFLDNGADITTSEAPKHCIFGLMGSLGLFDPQHFHVKVAPFVLFSLMRERSTEKPFERYHTQESFSQLRTLCDSLRQRHISLDFQSDRDPPMWDGYDSDDDYSSDDSIFDIPEIDEHLLPQIQALISEVCCDGKSVHPDAMRELKQILGQTLQAWKETTGYANMLIEFWDKIESKGEENMLIEFWDTIESGREENELAEY